MSLFQRITNFMSALLALLSGIIIIVVPTAGFMIAMLILGFSLLIYGLKTIIYYFRMARHMVGGRSILYYGVIAMDFGVFTLALSDKPKLYLALYLVGVYAFSGAIDIMRSLEARSYEASWRLNIIHGGANVAVAILCIVFIGSADVLAYIYGAGLIYSAIMRIIKTFRRTAVVYIQ